MKEGYTIKDQEKPELREKYLTKGNDIKPDDDEETIANKEKIRDEALKKPPLVRASRSYP